MNAKSLIAAAAIASAMAVALPATQAEAKTHINVSIGLGFGGFGGYYGPAYPAYYNPVYYNPGYAISCGNGRNIVDGSGFNNVTPIDCSLPGYRYTAWKHGHEFVVTVSRRGNINNVYRIF